MPETIAVSWFFILSGFILAYNFSVLRGGEETLKFVASRFWRLFPVQAITTLASLAPFSSSVGLARAFPADLLGSLTLTHTWAAIPFASQAFNVPAWSISVEWFFYLLLPPLIAPWVGCERCRPSPRSASPQAGRIRLVASRARPISRLRATPSTRPATSSFSIGPRGGFGSSRWDLRFASLSSRIRAWRVCELVQVALAIWAFLDRSQLTGQISFGFYSSFFGSWIITALVSAALIPALSLRGPLDRALSFPALVFFGEVSFSFYMTHMLVLRFADMHQID
jgi:peptidoglycan/LPS O-acetylase OafA/YrhL